MNEEQLRESLGKAFAAPNLTREASARIRGEVRSTGRGSKRTWRYAMACSVVGAVAIIAAPMARANYVSYSLSQQLLASRAFIATITLSPAVTHPGEHWRKTPLVACVADGVSTMSEQGGETYYLFEPTRMLQYRPRDGKAIARPTDQTWSNLLTLPDRVAERLGKFESGKQVDHLGTIKLRGKTLDEWRVDTGSPFGKVIFDVDPQSGSPMRMILGGIPGRASEIFEYDRDEPKARALVRSMLQAAQSAPLLDLVSGRGQLARQISALPAKQIALPRDLLTIYRVERNSHGDVFVLYTCSGKHAVEQNMGNWLRLRDASGTRWLSDVVDMSFSNLKLNGQYPKAQVFFHPEGAKQAGEVTLYAKMAQGEFFPDQVMHPVSDKGSVERPFGRFLPKQTAVGQPDWFYCAFSVTDTAWLDIEPLKLRFLNAMNTGQYRTAQSLGKELDARFPEMLPGFFYEKGQLYLALYKAYSRTNDADAARRYLRKAIEHSTDLADYWMQKELHAARQREKL